MPGQLEQETELHRTIRGGADFHLAEEMNEMAKLQDANRVMRADLRRRDEKAKKNARRRAARRKEGGS